MNVHYNNCNISKVNEGIFTLIKGGQLQSSSMKYRYLSHNLLDGELALSIAGYPIVSPYFCPSGCYLFLLLCDERHCKSSLPPNKNAVQ